MAGYMDVHLVSNNVGAISNDFRPLVKIPSEGGGITILSANYVTETAGTSTVQLVNLGTAGTAVEAGGTLFATAGTSIASAGIPISMTEVDTDFVDGGYWLGVKENAVGTTGAISIISFSYVMGKG
jgi:hypothetical protein